MDHLYLEIYGESLGKLEVPLETLIIYFVYKQLKTTLIQLNLIKKHNEGDVSFTLLVDDAYNIIKELPVSATFCVTPLIVTNGVTIVSGLCSVARQIIKSSDDSRKLLGFREACLIACNESSVWTKFCEIDMVKTIKCLLTSPDDYFTDNKIHIPEDLSRFECHLSQPVRIHNVYKVAQDQAKLKNLQVDASAKIRKEHLDLDHAYGEGPYMTLADVILYPLVHVFYEVVGINKHLPLIHGWYMNMTQQMHKIEILNLPDFTIYEEAIEKDIQKQSLYVSDPKRYKPKNRIYTKQTDITNALNIVNNLSNVRVETCEKPFGHEVDFSWSDIPLEANPEGGALPKSRMKRKCEQLENLTKAVMKIAKPNETIVDFCSGSGHLGILLAIKLPKCKIILLENKETSLNRARDRVNNLKLSNVVLLQCNLDYFKGDFDIGVCLHACGVATDLVIQHCLRRNAAFVACPCCYGGVHECHHISYPRSRVFQMSQLTVRDYLVLGHSADQTHDAQNAKTKQGIQCMDIIDTDRKYQAEELGYKVYLGKMVPETCTPKNNVLVGLPSQHLL